MMITTTTTNTNTNNTAQQQEQRMRDRWEDRVTDALFRKLKREVRARSHDDALLLGTPGRVEPDLLVSMWFMPQQATDVTRHAALVEECLDDASARTKRKGRSLPPLEYLLSCILESEALGPYLKRWKRDLNAAAAAAPTRARCAYPLMD
jgi:hypothetical protein